MLTVDNTGLKDIQDEYGPIDWDKAPFSSSLLALDLTVTVTVLHTHHTRGAYTYLLRFDSA